MVSIRVSPAISRSRRVSTGFVSRLPHSAFVERAHYVNGPSIVIFDDELQFTSEEQRSLILSKTTSGNILNMKSLFRNFD